MPEDDDYDVIPIGMAEVKREGTDITSWPTRA